MISRATAGRFTQLYSERRFYPVREQQTTAAGIRTNLISNLYVTLGEPDGKGSWAVTVLLPSVHAPGLDRGTHDGIWRICIAVRPQASGWRAAAFGFCVDRSSGRIGNDHAASTFLAPLAAFIPLAAGLAFSLNSDPRRDAIDADRQADTCFHVDIARTAMSTAFRIWTSRAAYRC